MRRRTLIAGALSVAGLAVTENVWAQPAETANRARAADVKTVKTGFIQADIEAIYQVPGKAPAEGTSPVVVLKARNQELYLCIWVGAVEGASISLGMTNAEPLRPQSHDLMLALVKALQGRIEAVTLHRGALEGTYYANITVVGNGVENEVDSRPSDALALASRVQAPILVATDMLRAATLEDIKKELKQP